MAHVIALAGVSRRAFYELFPNKEECFLATYDMMVAQARRRVLAAWPAEHGWENRMHSSCQSLLGGLSRAAQGAAARPRRLARHRAGREGRMQLAGLVFERIIATAFSLAPEEVCSRG